MAVEESMRGYDGDRAISSRYAGDEKGVTGAMDDSVESLAVSAGDDGVRGGVRVNGLGPNPESDKCEQPT